MAEQEVDTMFQDAVEAIRSGNRTHAKEILTRLLKTDQNNATYWIWMSASVDTVKERIYCLQTALHIDPENATAKRGLVLLGAAEADANVQPFPINRPRAWEQSLILAHEKPKEKGLRAVTANPVVRIAGWSGLAAVVIAIVIFGFLLPKSPQFRAKATNTFGPSPTYTTTPTFVNATAAVTSTYVGPTPLWALLPATYTPTPFYVPNISDPQVSEVMRSVRSAYQKGNWEEMIGFLQQGLTIKPDVPDFWYLIGEGNRFQKKYKDALAAYDKAVELNPNFGPAYVGQARVRQALNPGTDILTELNTAIEKDPSFAEAYILRANYYTDHDQPESALADLKTAGNLTPNSALVYYEMAHAYLTMGDTASALEAARRANQLDITMVPVYLVLGEAYSANNQFKEATTALQVYIDNAPEDPTALFILGKLNYDAKNYEAALDLLNRYIEIKNDPEARLYRGLTYVELGNGKDGAYELEHALDFFPNNFDARIALIRAYALDEKYGTAYQQAEAAFPLAETDEQKAQVYYWRASMLEKINQFSSAKRDWEALLALPGEAVPAEWRREATQHIAKLTTPTVTPKPVTPTRTPVGGKTSTPTPTRTPTPTPTPTKPK